MSMSLFIVTDGVSLESPPELVISPIVLCLCLIGLASKPAAVFLFTCLSSSDTSYSLVWVVNRSFPKQYPLTCLMPRSLQLCFIFSHMYDVKSRCRTGLMSHLHWTSIAALVCVPQEGPRRLMNVPRALFLFSSWIILQTLSSTPKEINSPVVFTWLV